MKTDLELDRRRDIDRDRRREVVVDGVVCYCGLGRACPHWAHMSVDERIACSQDKRQTAQAFFKGGMR